MLYSEWGVRAKGGKGEYKIGELVRKEEEELVREWKMVCWEREGVSMLTQRVSFLGQDRSSINPLLANDVGETD